jgi:spore germination cell wall hydrolase CwlJ-like protein
MVKQTIIGATLLLFTLQVAHHVPTQESFDWREVTCLAQNIYFEARGESRVGQLAVAHVTMNRTRSVRYPNSVCAVVYQKYQFSWTHNASRRITDRALYRKLTAMAVDVIIGKTKDPTKGSLSFNNIAVISERIPKLVIGNHAFY